jgi:hypothetical protein
MMASSGGPVSDVFNGYAATMTDRSTTLDSLAEAPDNAIDPVAPYDDLESLYRSPYIGGRGPVPVVRPGDSMIPVGARPLASEGFDIGGNVSWASKVLRLVGLTDAPNDIYRSFSLPVSHQTGPLADMLDPATGQLRPDVTMTQFAEAASKQGLRLAPHINGIRNSYWQAMAQGTMWATENSVVAVNIYNPTYSGIRDGADTFLQVTLGINDATVVATRMAIQDIVNLNKDFHGGDVKTPVYAHSQGTAIANLAIRMLHERVQSSIDLFNVGTATGTVPEFLNKFRSIANTLDPVPMGVAMIPGAGGIATSPSFAAAREAGRDYQVVYTRFDIRNDSFNHSLPYYFTDPIARKGLGMSVVSPLDQLYRSAAPWIKK